jgi:RNase P/RNase MRP subunit POP5
MQMGKLYRFMKLKLKPTLRIKRRYLLIQGTREKIERAVLDFLGALGWAKASPVFVEGGKAEGRVVIAVSRGEVDNMRAAFEASGSGLKVLKVSGTLKGLAK